MALITVIVINVDNQCSIITVDIIIIIIDTIISFVIIIQLSTFTKVIYYYYCQINRITIN